MKRLWSGVLILILILAGCRTGDPYFGSVESGETIHRETAPSGQETSEEEAGSVSSGEDRETGTEDPEPREETDAPELSRKYGEPDLVTDSDAFCVTDEEGNILFGQRELEAYAPASITKVMTALVTLDYVTPDEMVTITEQEVTEDLAVMSSGVYPSFKPKEKVTVRDLLYALILPSTNAAGNILACYIAGSNEAFAELMNRKASELGLRNSHFMNAHGLDRDGHFVCAYDMTLILRAALQNEELRTILSARSYSIPATEYTEERVFYMGHALVNGSVALEGIIAGKSGSTVRAGNTLVTAVRRGDRELYVCTLHSDEGLAVRDTCNLLQAAFGRETGTGYVKGTLIHNVRETGETETAVDLLYSVDNGGGPGRVVYWNMALGTADARSFEIPFAEGEVPVHLEFPCQGAYRVQLFVTGPDGTEQVRVIEVLADGCVNSEGPVNRDGKTYICNASGLLMTGAVETETDCFYTGEDGSVGYGFVGGRFYAGADGVIRTGWIDDGGARYFAQADGRLATGKLIIDGVLHTFSEGCFLVD